MNNLPTDVWHYIIEFIIPDKIKNTCLKNNSDIIQNYSNLLCINKEIKEITEFQKTNCLNNKKINFGNQIWCQLHDNLECKIIKDIRKITYNQNPLFSNMSNSMSMSIDKAKYSYHISQNHMLNKGNLKPVFIKVLNGTKYKISHICCSGKGLMFG